MILNTPNSRGSRADGYSIRAAAIAADLPQFTTITEFQRRAARHRGGQAQRLPGDEHSGAFAQQLFALENDGSSEMNYVIASSHEDQLAVRNARISACDLQQLHEPSTGRCAWALTRIADS